MSGSPVSDTELRDSEESDILPSELKHITEVYGALIETVEKEEPFINGGDFKEDGILNVQLLQDEQQIAVAVQPSPQWAMPSKEEYAGPYKFRFHINTDESEGDWMFSYVLNKLFTDMNTVVNITFTCDPLVSGLYLRALPVYSEEQHFERPVNRCLSHRMMIGYDEEEVDKKTIEHVVQIKHPQALYEHDEKSERFSVRLALDHVQTDKRVGFKFMCMTSCIGGMNSRPIEVIFTLEDECGTIIGRCTMGVKISENSLREIRRAERRARAAEKRLKASPTCAMPSTEVYPGPHNFQFKVDNSFSGRNWEYSEDMNKLFINIDTVIHFGFKCEPDPYGFFVRALPVYSGAESFQEPVLRCFDHRINTGPDKEMNMSVVLSDNSNAIYEQDEASGRVSVKVGLDCPQAGTEWVVVSFRFMCKNSCVSGMKRRPTEIIFTLEKESGTVVGREKLNVRICSCPKRDKRKEEADSERKQNPLVFETTQTESNRKKTKTQCDSEYSQICGETEYLDVLLYTQSRIQNKIKLEKREPNEKEAAILKKYEQMLNEYMRLL
ncbi:uncharacterized protein [Periplaneta americana]|uniref:uncharacterized protein isoform X1 n=1 Tax=Periplaneta americana TaxID=6978 RepID=UPI0037E76457